MARATTVTPADFDLSTPDAVVLKKDLGPGLLFVSASWCGHCQRTVPNWNSAAKALPMIAFYHWETETPGDMAAKKQLVKRLNVDAFPLFYTVQQQGAWPNQKLTVSSRPTSPLSRDIEGFAQLACAQLGLCPHKMGMA